MDHEMDTIIGRLYFTAEDAGMKGVWFDRPLETEALQELILDSPAGRILIEAEKQLREYFNGRRREFQLPLIVCGTEFQKKVWDALLAIPYGTIKSYQDIAVQAGSPGACRAVGLANHQNSLPILIPCHRVIGKNHALTGYAGGLLRKKKLLELEGVLF